MITNGAGTIFGSADDPFTYTRMQEIISNAYTMRSDLITRTMDFRRDYDKELGYPDPRSITLNDYLEMYQKNPIAARVVHVYPEESWQSPPEIFEDEDPGTTTPFEKGWQELCKRLRGEQSWYGGHDEGNPVWEVLKRADKLCGIGHYAIILLGIDDGKPLHEPVDGFEDPPENGVPTRPVFINNLRRKNTQLLYMTVFPEFMVQSIEFEKNRFSPRYNKPKWYTVSLSDSVGTVVADGRDNQTHRVHWSRVVHILDNIEASEIIGTPRMMWVFHRLLDLVKLYGGSAEMYWRGALPGISFETHPQLGGDVTMDEEDLKEKIWDYVNGLQRYLALTGMSAKSLSPQVVDPAKQIEVQLDAICILLGMPKRIFMGSERGQLASGQDDSTWNDRLRARKNDHITPRIIVPFFDRLIQVGVLPEPKEYFAVWPDPEILKPIEKAEVANKRVEAMAKYLQGQVDTLMDPMDFLTRELEIPEEEAEGILKRAMERVEEMKEEQAKEQEEAAKKAQAQGIALPGQAPPNGQQPPNGKQPPQNGQQPPGPGIPANGKQPKKKEAVVANEDEFDPDLMTLNDWHFGNDDYPIEVELVVQAGGNCGIGPGGFQPGNKCAKGGAGGGLEARVEDLKPGMKVTIGEGPKSARNRPLIGKEVTVKETKANGNAVVEFEGKTYTVKADHVSLGGGGTTGPVVKPVTKKGPTEKPPTPKPSSGGTIVQGKHVMVRGVDKDLGMATLNKMDKKTGGKLAKLLEDHPTSIDMNASLRGQTQGLYWPNNGSVQVKSKMRVDQATMAANAHFIVGAERASNTLNPDKASRIMKEAVLTHEFGHHVDFSLRSKGSEKIINRAFYKDNDKLKISKYSSTKPVEYFAESWAAYHTEPKRLTPTAKKMIRDVLKLI